MSESQKNIKVINLNEYDNFLNTSPQAQQRGGAPIEKPLNAINAVTPTLDPLNTNAIKDDASEAETAIEGDVDYSDIISEDASEDTQFEVEQEDQEEDQEEDDGDDAASTVSNETTSSTIQMLGGDPLFLVLSEYLANKKGDNIVTVLDKLNDNIEKLISLYTKQ
jgi:hypothetical protein